MLSFVGMIELLPKTLTAQYAGFFLYDGTSAAGTAHTFKFGTEGLEVYVPGSGIRFRNTVFADITGSGSVTLGYTG